jgi:hypothetical protein
MRLENGHWLCTWCSTEIDIALDAEPVTSLRATAGHANRHVVTVNGRDIHECAAVAATA